MEIGHLFAAADAVFAARMRVIVGFFVEACGGLATYNATEGDNVRILARHFPFEVDERAREIWLEKLCLILEESELSEKLRDMYWTWLEARYMCLQNGFFRPPWLANWKILYYPATFYHQSTAPCPQATAKVESSPSRKSLSI